MDFILWVNWQARVISFGQVQGFEQLRFHSHQEKLRFAMERSDEGFRIQ